MARPTKARAAAVRYTWIAGTVLVGACSANVMIDAPPTPPSAVQATSTFVPAGVSKALIGVMDGTDSVTFDPKQHQSFNLGPNHLDIPAILFEELVRRDTAERMDSAHLRSGDSSIGRD